MPKDIAEEFIKAGARRRSSSGMRRGRRCEDALQNNQARRLAQALTEAIAVVDACMLPGYNGQILKAITDRLTDNRRSWPRRRRSYKALGGK